MAMALATTGAFGGQHAQPPHNGRAVFPTSDLIVWSSWPHEGHRLWALMSDAFWVYVYKVHRCPNNSAHDWTLCPYAHRREPARRRDPRSYAYLPVACPDYRASNRHRLHTGSGAAPTCVRGLTCRYAHGVFELWLHPERFRTRMCDAGEACPRKVCFFAHCAAQLRREDAVVPFVGIPVMPPYIQHLTALPPQRPRPRPSQPTRVVAPISILPPPDTVMQTRSGQRLPLYYGGDKGASSPSSTVAPVVSAPANASISIIGSSTNISQGSSTSNDGSTRPAANEEFDEDDAHFNLIMNMLDSLMMD